MKTKTIIKSKKELKLPVRMFSKKDLEEMEVPFLKGKIFFNRAVRSNDFEKIPNEIKQNMAVLNYRDFSAVRFSEDILIEYIMEQINSQDCDFIILPYFKDETITDIRRKILIAGDFKSRNINRDIILEISQKSEIPNKELTEAQDSFDFISIFCGFYFGFYSNADNIVRRIIGVKMNSDKKIFCMGVPLKFEAENKKISCYLPLFPLICDFWIKNWKQGRAGSETKIIDESDLQSKNYDGWIKTYENSNMTIKRINLTIRELFHKKNKNLRKEYQRDLMDSILFEVEDLEPETIESYVSQRFQKKYFLLIMAGYNEKIIDFHLRRNDIFSIYDSQELQLLEIAVRRLGLPSKVMRGIDNATQLIKKEKTPNIVEVIRAVG